MKTTKRTIPASARNSPFIRQVLADKKALREVLAQGEKDLAEGKGVVMTIEELRALTKNC